jgi:hypothetical protein
MRSCVKEREDRWPIYSRHKFEGMTITGTSHLRLIVSMAESTDIESPYPPSPGFDT